MKNTFLDKLLNRINRVGADDLQIYLQQLAREKGFLETIFNTLQEGVLVIDLKGNLMYFNPSAQSLIGLFPESLGEPVAKHLREMDWPTILGDRKVVTRDFEITYPEPRYLSSYIVPLGDEKSAVKAYAMILHDLTAYREKTLETIEEEKVNALTLLAAGVAHELGNPLNSLNIHFQLLERDLRKLEGGRDGTLQESVQVVRREIERLDAIIHQFLKAVRPTQLHRLSCSVNEVIRETVAVLKPEIDDRDILVELELDSTLPPLEMDRDRMKQVFFNLIRNAVQAMRKGGILRIGSQSNDTHVLLAFSDNGDGILPENLSRLAEPFFTTKPNGTGLGLLIVRRIVREHGGELQIDSRSGHGTTVRVLLPLLERKVRLLTEGDRNESEASKTQ